MPVSNSSSFEPLKMFDSKQTTRREARSNNPQGATSWHQTIKPHYPPIDSTVNGDSLFAGEANATLRAAESILLAVVRFQTAVYEWGQSKTRPLPNLESNPTIKSDSIATPFRGGNCPSLVCVF